MSRLLLEIHTMPGHLIRRLHQISMSVFAGRMARAGADVTPVQFAALSAISANRGLDQATLAGLIAYDKVTIGGVVDRLVHKRLVDRTVSTRDRRARALHLTPAGRRLLSRLTPVVRDLQRDILAGLSQEETRVFLELLSKTAEAGNERSRAPQKTANPAAATKPGVVL